MHVRFSTVTELLQIVGIVLFSLWSYYLIICFLGENWVNLVLINIKLILKYLITYWDFLKKR
ncbi:TPA_asm: invasion associated endopeptidase, partial [Listeria monocytogenes]|nr:invasion associated endopeptidase [Listeria monocytogenes]